jgi:hypothetical protein
MMRQAFGSSNRLLAMSMAMIPRAYTPGDVFINDMTPLSDRGMGSSWGQAHMPYSDPYQIIYGDPLLTLSDPISTDTHHDRRGQRVLTTPGHIIKDVQHRDLNNDGLEDLLIQYADHSLELFKNYGGTTNPYASMGPLALLAEPVDEIMIGDTQGDGYDDILVRTNDAIRIYPNTE